MSLNALSSQRSRVQLPSAPPLNKLKYLDYPDIFSPDNILKFIEAIKRVLPSHNLVRLNIGTKDENPKDKVVDEQFRDVYFSPL